MKGAFPTTALPFYAGFGNRDTDVKAYRRVGVPQNKIFIINPEGTISHRNRKLQTSYAQMAGRADAMFPAFVPTRPLAPSLPRA